MSEPDTARDQLLAALVRAGGNRKKAARLLGIGRATLYRWLERHGLERASLRLIAGRYETIGAFGEGPRENLLLTRDRARGGERLVRLCSSRRLDAMGRQRLAASTAILRELRLSHLVPIDDGGLDPSSGEFFLAMARLPDVSLAERLPADDPVGLLTELMPALWALAELHRRRIVHRALSLEAFVHDALGRLVLAPPVLVDENTGLYGPRDAFDAPELPGGAPASTRTDVYAAGLVLRALFPGPVPDVLAPVLDAALDPDPVRRLPHAGCLWSALAATGLFPPGAELRGTCCDPGLLGRESLLAEAAAALDAGVRVLVLAGPAGMGRTRLLTRLLDARRTFGSHVVELLPGPDGRPAVPLAADVLPPAADDVGADLRPAPAPDDAPGPEPAVAADDGLAAISRRTPVLVALDDAEIAGADVLAWLDGLAARTDAPQLQVVVTAPPLEEAGPVADWLAPRLASGAARRLVLGPLERPALRAWAAALLGPAAGAAAVEPLVQHTGGVPALVEPALRQAVRGAGALPPRPAAPAPAAASWSGPAAEAAARLREGSALCASGSRAKGVALIREALRMAAELGDPATQARLLAEALIPYALSGLGAAARQCYLDARRLAAGCPGVAAAVEVSAARALAYFGDTAGSIRRAERAADALPPGDPVRTMALRVLADAMLRTGRLDRAETVAATLLEEATRFDRPADRVLAFVIKGEALVRLDEHDAARDHFEAARRHAEALDAADPLRALARLAIAREGLRAGDAAAASAEAAAILDEAIARRDAHMAALAAVLGARAALHGGSAEAALHWIDRVGEAGHGQHLAAAVDQGLLLVERARALVELGEHDLAVAAAQEALGLARGRGHYEAVIALAEPLHRALAAIGQHAAAARTLLGAARLLRRIGHDLDGALRRVAFMERPEHLALLHAARRGALATDRGAGVDRPEDVVLDGLHEVAASIAGGEPPARTLERIADLAVHPGGAEGIVVLVRRADGAIVPATKPRGGPDLVETARGLARALADTGATAPISAESPAVTCWPLVDERRFVGALCAMPGTGDGLDLRLLNSLAALGAVALGRGPAQENGGDEADRGGLSGELLSASPRMAPVLALLSGAASLDGPVLLVGEPGTGVDEALRLLHARSRRASAPLVTFAATGQGDRLEEAFFGPGGALSAARGGTLFVDGIDELPPAAQATLLGRLASPAPRGPAPRIVFAARRSPATLAAEDRLRRDLLERLGVVTIALPPLAERPEDIPLLARQFLERECARAGRPVPRIEAGTLRALAAMEWPGNLRQLENVCRRLVLLAGEGAIDLGVLEREGLATGRAPRPHPGGKVGEREVLQRALELAGGNRAEAARLLGVGRATLYRRLRKNGF